MSAKQDPARKNPYAAKFLREHGDRDDYLVESASSEDIYLTQLHRTDPALDHCSCPAPKPGDTRYKGPCWHIFMARLREQMERVEANSHALYRDWGLVELANEDARLREVLAAADSWLVRCQLGVVGDLVGAYFAAGEDVA